MNTHRRHHTDRPAPGQGRDVAMRWLARQLRWEHLLAELRDPSTHVADEEEAA